MFYFVEKNTHEDCFCTLVVLYQKGIMSSANRKTMEIVQTNNIQVANQIVVSRKIMLASFYHIIYNKLATKKQYKQRLNVVCFTGFFLYHYTFLPSIFYFSCYNYLQNPKRATNKRESTKCQRLHYIARLPTNTKKNIFNLSVAITNFVILSHSIQSILRQYWGKQSIIQKFQFQICTYRFSDFLDKLVRLCSLQVVLRLDSVVHVSFVVAYSQFAKCACSSSIQSNDRTQNTYLVSFLFLQFD